MDILRYLKPLNGLPDPRGSLSSTNSSGAINEMNREVERELAASGSQKKKKRGPYQKFSPSERAQIGKHAALHGATSASRHFSRKLRKSVSRGTAISLKNEYQGEVARRYHDDDNDDNEPGSITELQPKKRGRKLLLGDNLDAKVQLYLRKVREGGGAVSGRIAIAAARGILRRCNQSMLADNGGPIHLTKYWAHSLLKRMNFVQRKATTSLSRMSTANFNERKQQFLSDVRTTVIMEEIPGELVINWDQTGIKLVPSSTWTMEKKGERRVEMVGVNDKRQITAIFCGNALGDFLPIQLIYSGKTSRCHPRYSFPSDWNITHAPKHWSNEDTMIEYITEIILPYISGVRDRLNTSAALVVMDNFKGQATPKVLKLLDENNIHITWLPPNTTDRLQPMDLSVNRPAKEYLKKRFDDWYSEMVMEQLEGKNMDDAEGLEIQPFELGMSVLKEVSAKWLVEMVQYITDNPQFIVNGFIRSGITAAIDGVVDMGSEESDMEDDEIDSDELDFDSSTEND